MWSLPWQRVSLGLSHHGTRSTRLVSNKDHTRSKSTGSRVATTSSQYETRSFSSETPQDQSRTVKLACASGFWGDTPTAPAQLVHGVPGLQYLVFDYLSEVTMSLLAATAAKDPVNLGYAPDFVSHGLGPHLNEIKRKGKMKFTLQAVH